MVHPNPQERKLAITSLLLNHASHSEIMSRFPGVGSSTITRLRKKIFLGNTRPGRGRRPLVSKQSQRYIARLLCTGKLEGPPGVQRYLKSIGVKMSLHGIREMLKRMRFKAKRKVNTNFVSHTNRGIRLAWAKRHQQLTVDQWKSWIFSDETRVNMWGSDGNSHYWTDSGDILLPHQIQPDVQGDGGSVMFWSCITAEGPGYGTSITQGTVNNQVYTHILETSLLNTLKYYNMDHKDVRFQQDNVFPHTSALTKRWLTDNGLSTQDVLDWPAQSPDLNPIEHLFWYQLKRKLNAYPIHPSNTHELGARIETEWYKVTKEECLQYIDSMPKQIAKVIKAKGGPIRG